MQQAYDALMKRWNDSLKKVKELEKENTNQRECISDMKKVFLWLEARSDYSPEDFKVMFNQMVEVNLIKHKDVIEN